MALLRMSGGVGPSSAYTLKSPGSARFRFIMERAEEAQELDL